MSDSGALVRGAVRLLLSAAICGAGACGEGGGDDDVNGVGLGMQVQWASLASECGETRIPDPRPSVVSRIRVLVSAANGERCCVKIDPDVARRVVLTDLPEGDVTVDVAAFAGIAVPNDGVTVRCTVKQPLGIGGECDVTACAQSSYTLAAPMTARLRKGRETTLAACAVARPHFVAVTPACDVQANENPVEMSAVVAQVAGAGCECRGSSLFCGDALVEPQFDVVAKTGRGAEACSSVAAAADANHIQPTFRVPPVCCRDHAACVASGPPCCTSPSSTDEALTGFRTSFIVDGLPAGCAELRVQSHLPGAGADPIHSSFEAPAPVASPATPTPTSTPTITFTPSTIAPAPVGTPDGGGID